VARRGKHPAHSRGNQKEKAMTDSKQFLKDYNALVLSVWQNEGEEAKLISDPTAYAKQAGLPVEDGKTVVLDRSQPNGMLIGSKLVEAWHGDGQHVLHVPAVPLVDFDELSEDELEAAAGVFFLLIIIA
jgi:peroxiredoxin